VFIHSISHSLIVHVVKTCEEETIPYQKTNFATDDLIASDVHVEARRIIDPKRMYEICFVTVI
jgi:hypothetical protein